MRSWYARITDTVKRNDYTVYELRYFMTRDDARSVIAGTQAIVSAAKRKADSDVDTQEMDKRELQAAQLAMEQMEAFCAVLPFVENV